MKKILIALAVVLLFSSCAFSQEEKAQENMEVQTESAVCDDEFESRIVNEKSYAGFNFQKSPKQERCRQSIDNKGSWFNINIIINGKPLKIGSESEKAGNKDICFGG